MDNIKRQIDRGDKDRRTEETETDLHNRQRLTDRGDLDTSTEETETDSEETVTKL